MLSPVVLAFVIALILVTYVGSKGGGDIPRPRLWYAGSLVSLALLSLVTSSRSKLGAFTKIGASILALFQAIVLTLELWHR